MFVIELRLLLYLKSMYFAFSLLLMSYKFLNCNFSFSAPFVLHSTIAPALGLPLNPQAAAEAEKLLSASLAKIETIWLKGSGRFLLGSLQPTIADLSLVCEIMQLEVCSYDYIYAICS